MLALLKRTAVQLLVSNTDTAVDDDYSSWDAQTTLTLNVDDVRQLVPTLPTVPWSCVADTCSRAATPFYHVVKKTLVDDVNDLAQLLADMEHLSPDDYEFEESIASTAAEESVHHPGLTSSMEPVAPKFDPPLLRRSTFSRPPLRRRRKLYPEPNETLVIPSSDLSIPTITVTPCVDAPRDRSCLVPYQDVSFGNRLAVPMHPVVNGVHPPLLPKPIPYVDHWSFKDGHWWAVLPNVEEQMKRNMFSRPISRRRRPHGDICARPYRPRTPPHIHVPSRTT